MKLSLYTIEHELGGLAAGANLHSDCNSPQLDYPILFGTGDHRYYNNIAYVATSRQLEESKEAVKRYLGQNPGLVFSCICIGEPPSFCTEARNCDIVWTRGDEDRSRAFNAVQRIFQHFDAWERELGLIVDKGGELADLAEASLRVFKNDLCITDPFSRVLAYRVFRNERFPREWTGRIQEGECLPRDMVLDGVEDEREGQDFSSFHPTFPHMKAFDCTILRSVVGVSREYALVLSVHPNFQPVGKKDCAPALVLAEAVKRLYSAFGMAKGGTSGADARSILKAVVRGRQVPDSDLVQCALARGWNRNTDEYLCFCIDFMPNMQMQDCHFMRPCVSVCNRLQALVDCVAFVVDDRIVAVLDATQWAAREGDPYAEISRFAEEHRLAVGASAPCCGLHSLPNGYTQARAALRMAAEPGQRLARFGDHALDIGMDFIAQELEPAHFCPQTLVKLACEEPDLYAVLEAYLQANCNSNEASKQMGLPRNSFVYRLEKAKRLAGLDFEDPDVRLLALVSFRLVRRYGLDGADCPPPAVLSGAPEAG